MKADSLNTTPAFCALAHTAVLSSSSSTSCRNCASSRRSSVGMGLPSAQHAFQPLLRTVGEKPRMPEGEQRQRMSGGPEGRRLGAAPSKACLIARLRSYATLSAPSKDFLYKYSLRRRALRRIIYRSS